MKEEPLFTNRLIKEKSPYLLQHAHNPVDWFPWKSEAFQRAKDEDKPIFLSIGYATCHWCHVMEKESFENVEIAKLMNEAFINIKVDREELPEIDLLYMEFAQSMMSGAAGWPLNVILTPSLEPFFATTYLPPYESHGLMGLTDLIQRIGVVWSGEEREQVIDQAEKIVEIFSESVHVAGDTIPKKESVEDSVELFLKLADPVYGGMKGAPKFPIGYQYNFLLREAKLSNDSRALFLVERTLEMMFSGGIYDHLAGGFSRYSVDEQWLIPHFEKMLYDNALLLFAYLEAWQATKIPLFKEVTEEVGSFVLKEMRGEEGGFHSAIDADSEGKEGLFYSWTFSEIVEVLGGEKESEHFRQFYGVTEAGNFEGRNVLHTPLSIEEFSAKHKVEVAKLKAGLQKKKEQLLEVRHRRTHPLKDDKILAAWNGLMIYGLAEAGNALCKEEFVEAAEKAALFIYKTMWVDGKLMRRYRDGEVQFAAGLEDYAYLIKGLISLFESGRGVRWLNFALSLTHYLERVYKEVEGAFYQTDGSDPYVIVRKCQYADGAEPSGNGVHCENLLRLYQLTGNPDYLTQAEDVLKAVRKMMDNYSPGYCYHIMNLIRYYEEKAPTIVIALNDQEEHLQELMQHLYTNFIPHKALVIRKENDEALFNTLEYVKQQTPIKGKTTLYICFKGVCEEPITDYNKMIDAIKQL